MAAYRKVPKVTKMNWPKTTFSRKNGREGTVKSILVFKSQECKYITSVSSLKTGAWWSCLLNASSYKSDDVTNQFDNILRRNASWEDCIILLWLRLGYRKNSQWTALCVFLQVTTVKTVKKISMTVHQTLARTMAHVWTQLEPTTVFVPMVFTAKIARKTLTNAKM